MLINSEQTGVEFRACSKGVDKSQKHHAKMSLMFRLINNNQNCSYKNESISLAISRGQITLCLNSRHISHVMKTSMGNRLKAMMLPFTNQISQRNVGTQIHIKITSRGLYFLRSGALCPLHTVQRLHGRGLRKGFSTFYMLQTPKYNNPILKFIVSSINTQFIL